MNDSLKLEASGENYMTSDFEDVTLLDDERVSIAVNTGGHELHKGFTEEFGLPVEHFLKLYAVLDGEIVAEISSPRDLSVIVRVINSRDEAQAFLDLFTSLDTHYLFPDYKDMIRLNVFNDTLETGSISTSVFDEMGLAPDSIGEMQGEFEIERNLIRCAQGETCDILRVRETLSGSGEYSLVSEIVVAQVPRTQVVFPTYE